MDNSPYNNLQKNIKAKFKTFHNDVGYYISYLLFIIFIHFSCQLPAQYIFERQYISSPDIGFSVVNTFGAAININEDFLIVGDYHNNIEPGQATSKIKAGAVYSFKLDQDTLWRFEQKILPQNREIEEFFGIAIGLSGPFLAVGASGSTLDTNQLNFLVNAGAVYTYTLDSSGNWNWKQKLVPSIRQAEDNFGHSVSLSGNILAVGSPDHDYDSNNNVLNGAGSVFIFNRNSNGNYSETQHLTASDRQAGMKFGGKVVLLNENELFIGASLEGQNSKGAVYYFVKNVNGFWEEKQKIIATIREAESGFGLHIAVTSNTLVIGAEKERLDNLGQQQKFECGAVYVFERNGNGIWQQNARITAPYREGGMHFGSGLALNEEMLVAGAPFTCTDENNQDSILRTGAAFVYLKNASGTFDFFQKLVYQDRQLNDKYGGEVGLKGKNLIVGMPRSEIAGAYSGFCIFYSLKDTTVGFTEYNPKFARFDAAIYPNPTRGNFTLISNGNQLDRLIIYDVNGRLVYEENLRGKENSEVYLPDNVLNGLYLIRIETGREVLSKKLLVQNR